VLSIYLADAGDAGNEFDDLNARIGRLKRFLGWQDAGGREFA